MLHKSIVSQLSTNILKFGSNQKKSFFLHKNVMIIFRYGLGLVWISEVACDFIHIT